jgi:hypothetical protein
MIVKLNIIIAATVGSHNLMNLGDKREEANDEVMVDRCLKKQWMKRMENGVVSIPHAHYKVTS